jgi:A/G-specific adenine glycosylase
MLNYNGIFPDDYDSIVSLKGIGAYTASAIASFCFDLPYAVVDGNVLRILSRYFGAGIPVDSTAGKKYFAQLAQACLDKKQPGAYNQSIMDFGATVCKPQPLCIQCPLKKNCVAFTTNTTALYPVKEKAVAKKERWLSYFIFTCNHKTFVQQRTGKDIWQHLYEFYLVETPSDPLWNEKKINEWLRKNLQIQAPENIRLSKAPKQVLTHRIIRGYFINVGIKTRPRSLDKNAGAWLSPAQLNTKAFPRFINQYFSAAKP